MPRENEKLLGILTGGNIWGRNTPREKIVSRAGIEPMANG
jgi:hypothetical protein